MKRALISAAVFCALYGSAMAQETPKGPCERGNSEVKIGGLDLDQVRCEMALAQQNLGAISFQLLAEQAQVTLLQKDLKAANERADALQKQLDDLSKDDKK